MHKLQTAIHYADIRDYVFIFFSRTVLQHTVAERQSSCYAERRLVSSCRIRGHPTVLILTQLQCGLSY